LPIISLTYELYKKLLSAVSVLDRKYRYSLGENTISAVNSLLRHLILAKHVEKPAKLPFIVRAEADAEQLAFEVRAILELRLHNETECFKLQAKLREIRRQLGGWHKSLK